jgi:hypothetical protein
MRSSKKLKTDNEYTCANCHETFTKGLTEEEAVAQFNIEFSEHDGDTSDCVLICEDCFQKFQRAVGHA